MRKRPTDENSSYRARAARRIWALLYPGPLVAAILHADSIRKRVSVPDPALTSYLLPLPSSRRFPLARGGIHFSLLLLLHRQYSFNRLVFPVGIRQPQQRYEKRLINKLIRFLPTLRRTPFIFNLFFFLHKRLSYPGSSSRSNRTYGNRPFSASGNVTPRIRIQLTFH